MFLEPFEVFSQCYRGAPAALCAVSGAAHCTRRLVQNSLRMHCAAGRSDGSWGVPFPQEGASLLSWWTFSWLNGYVAACHRRRRLAQRKACPASPAAAATDEDCGDDVLAFRTPQWLSSRALGATMSACIARARPSTSLLWRWVALLFAFGWRQILASGLLTLASELAISANPMLFRAFVQALGSAPVGGASPALLGVVLLGGALLLCVFTKKILINQGQFVLANLGLSFRAALIARIMANLVVPPPPLAALPPSALQQPAAAPSKGDDGSLGETVNRIIVDTARMAQAITFGHLLWVVPVRIPLALLGAYVCLGSGAFYGIAFLLLVIACSACLGGWMKARQAALSRVADERLQRLAHVIGAVDAGGSGAAFGAAMAAYVSERRAVELAAMKTFNMALTVSASFNYWAPTAATMLAIVMYVRQGSASGGLPATSGDIFGGARAFTSIGPIMWIVSMLLYRLVAFAVSASRLDCLVFGPQPRQVADAPLPSPPSVAAMATSDDAEKSGTGGERPLVQVVLRGAGPADLIISTAQPERLITISGQVASGKSTLLACLAGSIEPPAGVTVSTVGCDGYLASSGGGQDGDAQHPIAHCPYPAWIRRGSVRDNILLERPFDAAWYATVIDACGLDGSELMGASGGAEEEGTIKSETQTFVSGGERERIGLARALYGRPAILLVDDILSCLNASLAEHIFERAFSPAGRITSPSMVVLLVTGEAAFVARASRSLYLAKGHVLLPASAASGLASFPVGGGALQAAEGGYRRLLPDTDGGAGEALLGAAKGLSMAAPVRAHRPRAAEQSIDMGRTLRLLLESGGALAFACLFVMTFSCELLSLAGDVLVKEHLQRAARGASPEAFIWRYVAICSANGVFTVGANVLSAAICLRISRRIHDRAITGIIAGRHRSALAMDGAEQDGTLGGPLSRLGRDIVALDYGFSEGIISAVGAVSALICMAISMSLYAPLSLLAVIPSLGGAIWALQRRFTRPWRATLSASGASLSPLAAAIEEVLGGVAIIRGVRPLALAMFDAFCWSLDRHMIASYVTNGLRRWLSVRCEAISTVFFVIILSFCIARWLSTPPPGAEGVDATTAKAAPASGTIAGMSSVLLMQSFRASDSISRLAKHLAEMETCLVSLHRISGLFLSEAPAMLDGISTVGLSGASKGEANLEEEAAISFEGVTLTYSARGDGGSSRCGLRGVTFSIARGEHVAIIGESGAGKSTIAKVLFSCLGGGDGGVTIQGAVRVACAPIFGVLQEGRPFIFATAVEGPSAGRREYTLRYNVDPSPGEEGKGWAGSHDAMLFAVLAVVGITLGSGAEAATGEAMGPSTFPEGLDTVIWTTSGLSEMEAQLICLARALLRMARHLEAPGGREGSALFVIDEATSGLSCAANEAVHRRLQRFLGRRGVTLVTVSHRPSVVALYDRALILSHGRLVEASSAPAAC